MSLGVCSGQAWGSKSTPGLAKASWGPELQPQDNLSGRKGVAEHPNTQNTHNTPPLWEDGVSGKEGSAGTACWEWNTPTRSRCWESGEVCRRKLLTLTGQLGTLHTQLPHHWATRA